MLPPVFPAPPPDVVEAEVIFVTFETSVENIISIGASGVVKFPAMATLTVVSMTKFLLPTGQNPLCT